MSSSNAVWIDDARATLETMVARLDEVRDEFDPATLPESVREMLVYVDVQCRELVRHVNV